MADFDNFDYFIPFFTYGKKNSYDVIDINMNRFFNETKGFLCGYTWWKLESFVMALLYMHEIMVVYRRRNKPKPPYFGLSESDGCNRWKLRNKWNRPWLGIGSSWKQKIDFISKYYPEDMHKYQIRSDGSLLGY